MNTLPPEILSPTELALTVDRPAADPGHLIPQAHPDHFPFRVVLTGITEPLGGGHESTSPITSVPQGTADGNTVFDTHQYATSAEAVTVGNAFPYHGIYAELVNRWQEDYQRCEELQRLPDEARLALTAVYLYVPIHLADEVLTHPQTEASRFESHYDSSKFARYVFARGSSERPLLEVSYEPSIMPCDLPPLDYDMLETMLREYDAEMMAKHPTMDSDALRGQVQETRIREEHPTATDAQLRLAYRAAHWLACDLVGESASEQERKARELEILNRLFSGQYVDVGGDYSADAEE